MNHDVRHFLAEAMGTFLVRVGDEVENSRPVSMQDLLVEIDEQVCRIPMDTIEVAILNLLRKLRPDSALNEQLASTIDLRMYLGPLNQRVRSLLVQALGTYVARVCHGNPTYEATHTMMNVVHQNILSTPFDLFEHSFSQLIAELLPVGPDIDTDPVIDIGINDTRAPGEPHPMVLSLPKTAFTDGPVSSNLPGMQMSADGCAICKDDYTIGELTVNLPCNHTFHAECVTAWSRHGNNCPLCRRSFNLCA